MTGVIQVPNTDGIVPFKSTSMVSSAVPNRAPPPIIWEAPGASLTINKEYTCALDLLDRDRHSVGRDGPDTDNDRVRCCREIRRAAPRR